MPIQKLLFIQTSFSSSEFDVVVKECGTLFEGAFKEIYHRAITTLPFEARNAVLQAENNIGKGKKGLTDFTFGELVGLFRTSKLLSTWAKQECLDLGLISNLDFAPVVDLRNRVTHKGYKPSRLEAELVFNYLRSFLSLTGLVEIEDAPVAKQEPQGDVKTFRYIKERGIIVNPEDGSRNVSYKVETLNNMLATIADKVAVHSDKDAALVILHESGYMGGKQFGQTMNEQWELEDSQMTLGQKVSKWCEFDSEVGWGKFTNDMSIDEDEGNLDGQIVIHENFLCHKRKKNDSFICEYMQGYVEGVIEELLGGIEVEVVCDMGSCPQLKPLKKKCLCDIRVKE